MTPKQKIAALRSLLHQRGLYAFLVPSTDAHQSEYVPACWQRRAWVSGFTGSAGELLVTSDTAGLWTDGRYFIQAENELRGSGIRLFKQGQPGVPTLHEFLAKSIKRGEVVGVDPRTISPVDATALEQALAGVGSTVQYTEQNLVDQIWSDQPRPSDAPIHIQPLEFAGETVASKLKRLRLEIKAKGADAHVLSTLDAIAWLYNIRGRDIEYNPVVIAYAIVTQKEAILYLATGKASPSTARKLGSQVTIRPYDEFSEGLRDLAARKLKVWVDTGAATRWIVDLLQGAALVTGQSAVTPMKARKNEVEIEGMRRAHVEDGVAMVRFLHWLERELPKGELTEISAADRLAEFRSEGEHFQQLSFRTISGYGPHGALPHYSVDAKSNVPLKRDGLYVLDSGGQYLTGTTDITRTLLLGKTATAEQKDRFTRVLKGHIALARAKFPAGTRGIRLDTFARQALWEAGLDYNHGTGHGVGAYLNVHEGPQSISPTRDIFGAPLEPGNILSNEPGYYEANAYGIRIENLILVQVEPKLSKNGATWHCFDTITLCPIETRLIEKKLLTTEERGWLNDYHALVQKKLSPKLAAADKVWLKQACAPI
ncbi:MAG: aminopeptidase P family protein [Candidatus Eisenbacteria bacterium]